MLAVVEGYSLALCKDVGLKSFKPRIVIRERLAPDRILDAPIDHVAEQGNPPQLHLEFGIGFRMRIGTVRMAHVAGDGIGAAERLVIMKNAFAFRNEAIGRILSRSAGHAQ